MPKQKEDPKQWLPLHGIPDSDCTLLEYWSRYHKHIADFRGFKSPQETTEKYTATLKIIAASLRNKKMNRLTAYDIWEAVISVRHKRHGKNAGEPYSKSTLNARLTVINDIYQYAEGMAICCNPIWMPPWQLIEDINYDDSAEEIKNKLREKASKKEKELPRGLMKKQEQTLMGMIMDHITEDGRWVALLLMLWCGFRPSEVRGLTYAHLHNFKAHPSRRYIITAQTATSDGELKDLMKNKQSVRAVPEHIELQSVLKVRSAFVQGQLSTDDLSHLPMACFGDDFERRCTATELSLFAKKQLRKLFKDDQSLEDAALALFADELADNNDVSVSDTTASLDKNADMEISARMLRRNYATKCYAETRMTDVQIRLTMGHKVDVAVHDPYGESSLWLILQNMDHRCIIPNLHYGLILMAAKGNRYEIGDTSKLFITVPKEVLAEGIEINITTLANEIGDDIMLELQRLLPSGSEITVKPAYLPDAHRHVDRINTDSAHWSLPKWLKDDLDINIDTGNDCDENK